MRNIQLSMMSIAVAVITVVAKDGQKIAADGFFQGYTVWTVACIGIIALGGTYVQIPEHTSYRSLHLIYSIFRANPSHNLSPSSP